MNPPLIAKQSIGIGVQLYSVRDDCARELPATLSALAKMGYAGVEFAGYHNRSAKELRQMLDDDGLKCCGTHIGLDQLTGDALPLTIEYNLELGNPYLIVPWIPDERRSSHTAWLATADLFNQIAVQLAVHGLRTGYHNHHIEFEMLEGETGFDTFFGHTQPAVIMQLDIGNAMHGGADPLACLKRYVSAAGTIHLKEYSSQNPEALLGEGEVPWQAVFDICEQAGKTDWYIVEQESYPVSPLESVQRCRAALKKMGK
jgi:sugar phosphate isomerase/epimerase